MRSALVFMSFSGAILATRQAFLYFMDVCISEIGAKFLKSFVLHISMCLENFIFPSL